MTFLMEVVGTNGTPHTSAELMNVLMANGFSFESARGVLGYAVAKGFITCVFEDAATKIYL